MVGLILMICIQDPRRIKQSKKKRTNPLCQKIFGNQLARKDRVKGKLSNASKRSSNLWISWNILNIKIKESYTFLICSWSLSRCLPDLRTEYCYSLQVVINWQKSLRYCPILGKNIHPSLRKINSLGLKDFVIHFI